MPCSCGWSVMDTNDTRVTGLRLEGHRRKCVCKAVAEFAADDDLVVGGTIPPRFGRRCHRSSPTGCWRGCLVPLGTARTVDSGIQARIISTRRRSLRLASGASPIPGCDRRGGGCTPGGKGGVRAPWRWTGKPPLSSWPGSRRPRIHGAPGDPAWYLWAQQGRRDERGGRATAVATRELPPDTV